MKASQAQEEAKEMLHKVVEAIGWTEEREVGWSKPKKKKTYIISDKGGHPMHKTKTGYKQSKWGSMCVPSNPRPLTLKVQTKWWEEHSKEERLGLIIHEATHIKIHSGNGNPHRPEFWEVCIDNYRKVAESPEFEDFDWEKVAEFAVQDPNRNCVDRRSETVEERRQKMEQVREFR